jgi:hypothetical protein
MVTAGENPVTFNRSESFGFYTTDYLIWPEICLELRLIQELMF